MIKLTEKAISKALDSKTGKFLRVRVVGGGCSGLKYELSFCDDLNFNDINCLEISPELSVIVDDRSLVYLKGTTIDYDNGLNGQGFTYTNPNSTRGCGCGTSFGV